jgi:hypothetical protein
VLRFDVVTIFPQMLDAVTAAGVTGRARDKGIYELVAWNPRDFSHNAYRTVDDRPYGGGPGHGDDGGTGCTRVGGSPRAAEKRRCRTAARDSPVAAGDGC